MDFWRFVTSDALGEPLRASYDPVLVVLSVLIASLGAATALAVVNRVLNTKSAQGKLMWHGAGAIAMGLGVWAMHFTGMLAFTLPVATSYDLGMTAASGIPAILGSAVGLAVMSRQSIEWWRLQLGGLSLAVGIGAMHYLGMEAVRAPVEMRYVPALFVLSILVAHVLASVALYVRFFIRGSAAPGTVRRIVSALAMGLAVSGMHYTAMAAARFYARESVGLSAPVFPPDVLGITIFLVVALFLTLAFLGTVFDQRLGVATQVSRDSMARHRAAVETMPDGLLTVDAEGAITTANPSAMKIFGRTGDSLLGLSANEVLCQGDAADEATDSVARVLELLEASEEEAIVATGCRADGTTFDVDIRAGRMLIGEATLYSVVLRDVTAQRALERQLGQSQKLEAIGQLAAGIAHEINTPTQYVGDNTRFLADAFSDLNGLFAKLAEAAPDQPPSDDQWAGIRKALDDADVEYLEEEIPKALEQSIEGIERVTNIVRAMKEFSHPSVEKTSVDLNRAISSTLIVASNEWKYVADCEKDLDPGLPHVTCVPGEFNQVILNMIVNASHAIADVVGDGGDGKGMISIRTRHVDEWAEIEISDSGSGMPEHVMDKVFDPFFTTKDVGKGTGQGLSIAHSVIVQNHGGSIDVESEAGKGTRFTIRLPIDGAVPTQPEETEAQTMGAQ